MRRELYIFNNSGITFIDVHQPFHAHPCRQLRGKWCDERRHMLTQEEDRSWPLHIRLSQEKLMILNAGDVTLTNCSDHCELFTLSRSALVGVPTTLSTIKYKA